jgi:hypothetical protein
MIVQHVGSSNKKVTADDAQQIIKRLETSFCSQNIIGPLAGRFQRLDKRL